MCKTERKHTTSEETIDINRGRGREYYQSLSAMRDSIEHAKVIVPEEEKGAIPSKGELHRQLSEQYRAQKDLNKTVRKLGLKNKLNIGGKTRNGPGVGGILKIAQSYNQLESRDKILLDALAEHKISPQSKRGVEVITDNLVARNSTHLANPIITETKSGPFFNRKITTTTQNQVIPEPNYDGEITTERTTFFQRLFHRKNS